jgi:hypothetical protein
MRRPEQICPTQSARSGVLEALAVPAILEGRGGMVTVGAHFDGQVIVPDEPLDLPPHQALIVQIELARTWLLREIGSR